MPGLRAAKFSEHLCLISTSRLFPAPPSMLPSDKSVESQFFVASWVILMSQERRLVGFPIEKVLEAFGRVILRSCPLEEEVGFLLGTLTGTFDSSLNQKQ